jgi:hypothetical protein
MKALLTLERGRQPRNESDSESCAKRPSIGRHYICIMNDRSRYPADLDRAVDYKENVFFKEVWNFITYTQLHSPLRCLTLIVR